MRWKPLLGGVAAGSGIGMLAMKLSADRRHRPVALDGADGSISIDWSERGVPRISGASRNDAMFGLGYAMAADRPVELDLSRRAALGQLAEIAGPEHMAQDRLMRLIDMAGISHRLVQQLDTESIGAVEALTAGINHRLDTAPISLTARLLGGRPRPWRPSDCLAIFRLLAWSLTGAYRADLGVEFLRSYLDGAWIDAIYQDHELGQAPIATAAVDQLGKPPRWAELLPHETPGAGSNAWVVSAERSSTGAPLLASDPHLELRNPSIWYEASLEAPGLKVAGATIPGIPSVVIGRNPDLAWGITNAMTSQAFLYREEVDEESQRVRDGDGWLALTIRYETIHVRGQNPEIMKVRSTPRGPLLSDLLDSDAAFSLYWTGMEISNEVGALLAINESTTVQEMQQHLKLMGTPTQNLVTADSAGSIAMFSAGRMPQREQRFGLLDPADFPPRYLAADDMPAEINPERGWLACANNRMLPDGDARQLRGLWAPDYRYRRIAEVLESRSKHSPAEMRKLQLDVHSLHARETVPDLLQLIDGRAPAWVIDDLRSWDYETGPESRATLLFETIYREWTRLALAHRLPDEAVELLTLRSGHSSVPMLFVNQLLAGQHDAWWSADPEQTRSDLAAQAVDAALEWLAERLGPDHEQWQWGQLHTLTLSHPLAQLPGPQQRRLRIGPAPIGGTRTTVAPQAWESARPYESQFGASLRLVANLGNPAETWFITPPGQSESPISTNYQDQFTGYLQGFAHRLRLGEDE